MSTTILSELPLIRAKVGGIEGVSGTGPHVGPGTYDLNRRIPTNESRAPFNSTSERLPLSLNDPCVPGPGTYTEPIAEKGRGITACPFVSDSSRFPVDRAEEVPGPGAYNVVDRWPTKKNPRAHRFAFGNDRFNPADGLDQDPASNPGYYSPNYAAADRRYPKAAFFAKYSGRDAPRVDDTPGPGSYNVNAKARSLYDGKPSSMFATRTARTDLASKDTPGPGSYNVPMGFPKGRRGDPYSGFGSSAGRFADKYDDAPGPGAYTGEVAPRRPKPQPGNGTSPFASNADRFGTTEVTPGPGTYDGRLFPKHMSYGAETPFMSTVKRFGPTSTHVRPLTLDERAFARTDPKLRLRSNRPLRRPFYGGEIHPSSEPKPLPERVYDVKYDWPKPECTAATTFGSAPRLAGTATSDAPGPGYYDATGGPKGSRYGNSTWPRDVRLKDNSVVDNRSGGGFLYYDSTLLKKSHNVTIGADTMWLN